MGEYYIRRPDELYHYGIKGMKWGVRHDPERSGSLRGRYHRRAAASVQRDIDSFRGHENGIYTKRGRQVMSKKDVADTIRGLEGVRDKSLAKADKADLAKAERKGKQKTMSTVKKVAIGVGVATAVAGVTYVSVKAYRTSKYNKAARAAVQRAIRSANKASSAYKPGMNLYKESTGHYKMKAGRSAIGSNIGMVPTHTRSTSGKIRRKSFGNLTGHSGRVTKVGAASYRAQFYNNKAQNSKWVGDSFTNASSDKRKYSSKANEAYKEYERLVKQSIGSGKGVPRRYNYYPVNKLRRQKKFKIIG